MVKVFKKLQNMTGQLPTNNFLGGFGSAQALHLQEDVDGLDGGHLEDVVGPGQDRLEPELDDRPEQVEELVDLLTNEIRQNLSRANECLDGE